MSQIPKTIKFGKYTEHIPPGIPKAVQQATTRFWTSREARVAELPQWEDLRQAASEIRLHTLQHLDVYLQRFVKKFTGTGGHVHWAADGQTARKTVLELARSKNVETAVKVKSMATEEIGLNAAMQSAGIEVWETDLGEFIAQLAGVGPSHIIVPAVHMTKEEIASLFTQKLGVNAPADPEELAAIARRILRQKFLAADMGISGANFLVAETGTLVIVTNEGNGRMCTTIPDLHVAVVGVDKVVPDWESLTVLLKLLARSATGQKLSTYTSFITGPRRSEGEYGPKEMHLILLDDGRTRILRDSETIETLKCIRCGCCLNICPVYKNVGGFAYGWFISGPVGALFSPQILGTRAGRELPFASTLCGACNDVCPVKIPITKILLHLRSRVVEGDAHEHPAVPLAVRLGARLTVLSLGVTWLYRFGGEMLHGIMSPFNRDGWMKRLPPPLDRWTKVRPFPVFKPRFRKWWARRKSDAFRKSETP
jgi:L-lactate dehydrogenase complex protein LldF